MVVRNIKIGTRLVFGFGGILLFVALMAVTAYYQSGRLWRITSDLYEHPLQVSRATRDIKADVLSMHILLEEISANKNLGKDELFRLSKSISDYEIKINNSFRIIYDRYLGEKSDIDTAYNTFMQFKNISDEIINVGLSGDTASGILHLNMVTLNDFQTIAKHIQVMIDFAKEKSDAFYLSAKKEKSASFTRLLIVTSIIFILTMVFAILLIRGIRQPLEALTMVAEKYRQGNYDARVNINSADEIGMLGTAFNRMADAVQTELKLKEDAVSLSEILAKENELKPFCQILIKTLFTKTQAQIAAIYFLNSDKKLYEHYESVGLSAENIKSFSSELYEGEFGSVLATRKIQRISQIPEVTSFGFSTVSGNFRPREIITIPIVENETIVAIISLASLHVFSNYAYQFVKQILSPLTTRLIFVMLFQKISDFSSKLDKQNKELEDKTTELMMQSDELKEYNIELELQKRQLNEANQLKSAFLANMSHELRTPLNSVIALSGVLHRRLKNAIPEDEHAYLGIIEKNGKQLLTLINDILDLSKIEAGKDELIFTEFSLFGVIQNILDTVKPLSNQKEITLTNSISPQLPAIISDKGKCHHILQNIVSNAVKFTEKGSIEISAFLENDCFRITIKDTGIGIAAEHLPFIFDEFRQADDKASRRYGGTGLGLAIAKKYTLMLNGQIEVESQPGCGSVFAIILPAAPTGALISGQGKEFPAATSKNTNTSTATFDAKQTTILLVEDSEPQIIQLTDILKPEGYNIRVARNGKEALESVKMMIPDAMVLDLMMPEIDGFEVLRSVRNLQETSKIPVLILSAKHVTKEELSFLHENNIHELIQKGDINRIELLQHIRDMVTSAAKETAGNKKKQPARSPESAKAHILHIEDNPDNQASVKALLSKNFIITDAADGPTGLQKARDFVPDLILLDISLPGMDGFTVFNELRKDNRLQNVPIIALTARAMKGDRESLLQHGFDGYISKPVDNIIFEKMINEWLYGK